MKKRHIVLIIGLLLWVAGLAAWIYQLINGMGVTNLSNSFSWGLYMGTFEFFIGIASGGMLLFSIAYLFKAESFMPFTKLAAVSSLGSVVAAGVIIVVDMGQPFRVLQMLLTPNFKSPIFWDLAVLSIYAALCLIAVIIQFLPHTKKNRDKAGAYLDCGRRSRAISFFALPFVIVMNVVVSLMFSVQNSREWWNSALLPVESAALAAALGLSFMILVCLLAVGRNGFLVHESAFALLAKISGTALLAALCFTALELTLLAWSNTAENNELLKLLFDTYGLLYAAEIIMPFIAMIMCFTKRGRKSPGGMAVMSLLVMAGGFIHRMMLLLPAFNMNPLTIPVAGLEENLWSYPMASGIYNPGEDIFVTFWNYFPTAVEWCANLLPFGLTIVVIAGAMSLHPMVTEGRYVTVGKQENLVR